MKRLLAGKLRPALMIASLLAAGGCSFNGVASLPLPGGPDTGSHPYSVKIDFENVLDLVPQSTCKVNDVSVGKVTDVKLTQWHAVVTCKLRGDAKLPADTTATIDQTSLLGEKFVSLQAPSGGGTGQLKNGAEIPLSRTSTATDIEEVLSALSMLLNGGGIEQISTITHELNAAMNGRTDTIKDVLNQVNTFTATLDVQKSQIIRAIDSIDRLTKKLSDQRQVIADTIDKTGPAVQILKDNRADLTKMLVSLGKLGDTTTNVINKSQADLLTNLKNLQPILANANKAGANLPKGLEMLLSYPFPPTYANAQRGDYANIHLTVDLDLSNLLHNLLGGTALEKAVSAQSQQVRSQLKPPQITVPQSPVGVLSSPAPSTGTSSSPSTLSPAGADSGLYRLMTEGLT